MAQPVPQALSERRAIPFDEARHIIEREYQAVQHTMNWYCFDYWSERLDLDIYRMTSEVGSRARLREDTEPFYGRCATPVCKPFC